MSDYNIPVSGGVNGLNVPLHGHIAVYNKEFPVIPNPEGEVTGYVTKLGFTPEILQVKDPEVHDWARAEEKPTYTKAEVGLGNVDNTSDLNKPISTATQTALDGKVNKVPGKALSTNDYTDTDKAIVDGVTSALATKVDKIAGKGLSSNDYTDYEKTKLAYIQSGAEANVQADWFESNRWSDAFILNKPTKLSDFSNDTGFITSTVDNLTYYYKKSETYTQAEVNALIGSIVTISFLVVQTLPQTGEANIIYLVPADEPNPDNIYEEYIYVNNNWEMIGTTKVDLSNYYTKTETDTLLNGKVDKDGNKVLSDNNYSDTDKTKLDGIEAEANKTVVDNSVTSTSTNPVESKAIYNLLNDLLPEATATGNPIAITNASGLNAKSLKVELEPIQDLHGYDKPWPGGSGKNKLPVTATSATVDGITFTVASDGRVTAKGEATANAVIYMYDGEMEFPAGEYILNGCPSGGGTSTYSIRYYLNGVYSGQDAGTGKTITISNGDKLKFYIRIAQGQNVNLTFEPMLRLSSEADGTFAPYSNICPISGRTQTEIRKCGFNIWDEEWESGSIDTSTGAKIASNTDIRSKNNISVLANTKYYIKKINGVSTYVYFFNNNDDILQYVKETGDTTISVTNKVANCGSGTDGCIFTTPADCAYILLKFTTTSYSSGVAVNYPSTETSYNAYNGEDTTIQFGQTVYGGEVDVTNGVLKITHAYIHLTEVSKSGNQFFAPTPNDMVKMRGNYTVKEIRSNLLPTVATNGTVANNALGITGYNDSQGRYPNQNWIYLGNGDPNITTNTQMNEWLANNPLYVCYKLATPIEVPLTPQIISLLKGNNTLTADGDMELIYSKTPQ